MLQRSRLSHDARRRPASVSHATGRVVTTVRRSVCYAEKMSKRAAKARADAARRTAAAPLYNCGMELCALLSAFFESCTERSAISFKPCLEVRSVLEHR